MSGRYVLTDFTLPHQILLEFVPGGKIGVSCNCLVIPTTVQKIKDHNCRKTYIEARTIFPANEAIATYKRWHAERGIPVAC